MGGRPRPRSRGDQVIGPKGGGPRQERRGAPSRNRVRSFHRRHRKASSLAEPVLQEKLDSHIALRLAAAGNALAGNFDNAQRAMAQLRVEAARIATALARPLDIRFVGDVGHPPWHGRDLSSICGNAAHPQSHAASADEMDGPDVARRFQASPVRRCVAIPMERRDARREPSDRLPRHHSDRTYIESRRSFADAEAVP